MCMRICVEKTIVIIAFSVAVIVRSAVLYCIHVNLFDSM